MDADNKSRESAEANVKILKRSDNEVKSDEESLGKVEPIKWGEQDSDEELTLSGSDTEDQISAMRSIIAKAPPKQSSEGLSQWFQSSPKPYKTDHHPRNHHKPKRGGRRGNRFRENDHRSGHRQQHGGRDANVLHAINDLQAVMRRLENRVINMESRLSELLLQS